MTLSSQAEHDKQQAAFSSVIAALALTGFKIIVGIMTGSLGILAEAAHSSLDLVAALVTLFAVRVSGKPPDDVHLYGHGKIENLSALFEALLLLATCAWIIYEAIQRIFLKEVHMDISIWAFLVMVVSIAIDFTRSRVLYRAAKKYGSQALEADALHFSTDIWSSGVVILGLLCVKIGEWIPGLEFLNKADAIAALGVALIVIYVSIALGIRTVHGLLDSAPPAKVEEITKLVESVPGVLNCHHVRMRHSGPHLYIDVHVLINGDLKLDEVHLITDKIEVVVNQFMPTADIVVHPEPAPITPLEV